MQLPGNRKKYPCRSAAVLLVIAVAYLAYLATGPGKLEFVELSSPPGFRTLVFEGKSSRFGPVFGPVPGTSNAAMVDETAHDVPNICEALLEDEGSPTVGKPDKTVSIVEFFDYRCPYCKILTKILANVRADGRVRIIYKEWPILGESSQLAARAALAAAKQGKYLAFHEKLMQSRFIPTIGYIEDLSRRLGADKARLLIDMNSGETSQTLRRNKALASRLGLSGTPVLVVGHTIVEGALTQAQLERLIAYEISSQPVC